MRVAIVDDEYFFCSKIRDIIKNKYTNMEIDTFENSVDYLNQNDTYEITILDIQMPGIDGIQLSKIIGNKSKLVIFVTSLEERMQDAFGINIYGFILKEQLETRLIPLIESAISSLNNNLLNFSTKSEDIYIYLNDIYFIQIENRRNYLYTRNGVYNINRQPLSEIYKRLNTDFCYVSQSCIVNLKHIVKRDNTFIIFDNEQTIPISYRYRKKFKLNYMRKVIHG